MLYLNLLLAFAGYLLGRFGHAYLNVWLENPDWAPHHWIYGAILMVVGFFFRDKPWGWAVFFFGLGHFISDLKDFINLKFIGPDEEGPQKFWGVD
ncbi:hypothetical protein A2V54_03905 [candidate division WWE3 bacterium RBG_19FT_COMBO_53_11]|uniref:Uncharacterized protein n=1 Tax=candidate division WWE3 bacterium RBG_19FT_COMBO_53_11 TaxID=1802613 RepID=A0A1F4UIT2_UNCKA|nr:MAG: hypothetical protein A2155_00145 [candidate division WWE3 bacterium RBG_16_52_45]OGC44874.1 MAG: hypothetical protein A2V54_03905 [candidate division WWE3 bacterium RBG_19FT_COMBO_53_11]